MKHKAIFLPKPGYKCLAYGYGRGIIEGQEERIRAYLALRQSGSPIMRSVDFATMYMEPKSLKALKAEFRQRPAGHELIKVLQPGDHVIVDTLDRVGSLSDISSLDRHFAERSICLHVVDFGGCSIDFSSPTGRLIVNMHLMGTEYRQALKEDKYRVTQARLRAKQLHAGGGVPFFCRLHKKKLYLRKWAVPMMEKVAAWSDAGLGPIAIFRAIKESKLDGCRKVSGVRSVKRLESFYRTWVAAGRPEINTFDIYKFVAAYKEKQSGTQP